MTKMIKILLFLCLLVFLGMSLQKYQYLKQEKKIALAYEKEIVELTNKTKEQVKIKKAKIAEQKRKEEAERKKREAQKKIQTAPKAKFNPNKTQFVALAFDGSRSNSAWEKTRAFARQMRAAGKALDFTYFISGVYLLPQHQKKLYNLSWKKPARSNINFGDSQIITDERINNINLAVKEGHEIASHLNGHFDGTKWTEKQWLEEIDVFNKIIDNTLPTKIDRNIQLNISSKDIIGIRTPLLSRNPSLYTALKKRKYLYDTSKIYPMQTIPKKDKQGVMQFPLVSLRLGNKRTLSMDYNHFVAQTKGKSTLKAGTPEWTKAKNEIVSAYMKYFETEYNGARAPINIGHHFSMWNDGVYWAAMKEFAKNVCGKEKVRCTSYKNIMKELEKTS